MISKDTKTKLKNPPQFEDTMLEINVVAYLILNKIKNLKLGKSFPDIEIPDKNIIIEVKNLHTSQKLLESNGEVVLLNDIRRIWSRISKEILPKLKNNKINIILFDVPAEVSFDEFEDLFIFSNKITIDRRTKEIVPLFKGEYSKEANKKISAVVMLKNNCFKGIINPLNEKEISDNIKKLFNLINI